MDEDDGDDDNNNSYDINDDGRSDSFNHKQAQ